MSDYSDNTKYKGMNVFDWAFSSLPRKVSYRQTGQTIIK